MTRRATVRLMTGLLVTAALLSGCSEKQEANETLPSSSAAETTADLPPLGPEDMPVPDDAREKTPEGALAFAKYYISLSTEIGAGNLPADSLLDLSTAECRYCSRVAASFTEEQAAGYRHVGGSYTFEEYGPPLLTGDVAEIGFEYTQTAYTVVDPEGRDVPSEAGQDSGVLQSGMRLEWHDEVTCWLVAGLNIG